MRATLGSFSRQWCAISLLMLAGAGCASPFTTNYLSGSRKQEAAQDAAQSVDPAVAANDPKAAALRKANGQAPATADEALAGVLDELQQIGAIDPAAQQQVMADLKDAKPEHYELIVSQFQAALAYRQQLAERELEEGSQLATDEPGFHDAPRATLASRRTRRKPHQDADDSESDVVEAEVADHDEHVATDGSADAGTHVTTAAAVVAEGPDAELQQAALVGADEHGSDWRAELDAAIRQLQGEVRPQPATVAELHDHLRLRALLLAAGRDEEAYRPIPGASPAQQDYWSKQLFAMAAYLNTSGSLDDKQRAAAALVHVDDARAALAQMATLQVRNASFAKSVEGFGAYEPLEQAEFQPGEKVTVYAEIENFASASTAAGYETVLATSYQVVDSNGRRIDGGQFPDVSDVCRGRRRDFHLQYGVALPTRIYPDEYRLELTITDQQSGKIGQATLPFEIAAGP